MRTTIATPRRILPTDTEAVAPRLRPHTLSRNHANENENIVMVNTVPAVTQMIAAPLGRI